MKARRVRRWCSAAACVLLTGLSTAGCHKKAAPSGTSAALKVAPVPRPDRVVAEFSLAQPKQAWPRVRALAGGLAELLPTSPELALTTFLSLPPLTASAFRLDVPLAGVWLAGTEAHGDSVVLAVHVENGPEFVAQLSTGNAPSHRSEKHGALTLLLRAGDEAHALGVIDDVLLVGARGAIEHAGLYAARGKIEPAAGTTLSLFMPGAALSGHVAPWLRARWAAQRTELERSLAGEQQRQGRPPDFGEPGAVLLGIDAVVEAGIAVLASAREARASLSLGEERLDARAELSPNADGAARQFAAELPLGELSELARLPVNTAFALARRRTPSVAELGAPSALFGGPLARADAERVQECLRALDAGRGSEEAFALLDDLGLVWRGPVVDAAGLSRGLEQLLTLLTQKPFSEPLAQVFGRPSLTRGAPRAAEPGVTFARLGFASSERGGKPRRVDLAWLVEPSRFLVSVGTAGDAPLARARAAERGELSLGASGALTRLLPANSARSWLVYADLARLGLSQEPAPLALALGAAKGGSPELSLSLSNAAVRAAAVRGLGR